MNTRQILNLSGVFLIWIVNLLFIQVITVYAQPVEGNVRTKNLKLPTGIPSLPGPQEGEGIFIISAKNVAQFEELLLEPLDRWLKAGNFVMRAVNNLDFDWVNTNSNEKDYSNYPQLDAQENIVFNNQSIHNQLPFGSAEIINIDGDPLRKAYKILWNVAYVESGVQDILYYNELAWVGSQSMLRKSRGTFYRYYSVDDQDNLTRKEVLRLLAPSVVLGFSMIGYRFIGPEEDQVYIHSPVVGKTRRLLGSNRSDGLIGGNLAFDDIFVWSEKVQNVDAKVVGEKILLVPFPSLTKYQLENEATAQSSVVQETQSVGIDNKQQSLPTDEKLSQMPTARGKYLHSDGTSTTVLWNYDSQQLRQITAWTPTTVSFVPRKVWLLELNPRDPYYLSGTEILVVDQQTMLPVYKLVYSRNGQYYKTVIGGWGFAFSEKDNSNFPFNAFVLVVNAESTRAEILTTQYVRTFSKYESGKEPEILVNLRSLVKPQLDEKEESLKPDDKMPELTKEQADATAVD